MHDSVNALAMSFEVQTLLFRDSDGCHAVSGHYPWEDDV